MSFIRAGTSKGLRDSELTSGIPSFEKVVIGSDLPLGSVLTVHQDWPKSSSNYSSALLKCYISTALYASRHVYLVHPDPQYITKFLESCPVQAVEESTSFKKESMEDKLKIAHRYKHLQLEEPAAVKQSHYLDLTSHLNLTNKTHLIHILEGSPSVDIEQNSLVILVDAFAPHSPMTISNILDWKEKVRSKKSLLVVSVPEYCMEPQVASSLSFISDCVVQIRSLSSSPQGQQPEFREYDGFAQLIKPLSIPFRCIIPSSLSVAFKCKSTRRFVFEPFHLPPDMSEAPSRQLSNCSTKALDF